MPRPIQALIHPSALAHNLGRAREAAPDARVWAVVKANAYGHGIERAFEGLRGADGFAMLDFAEAQRLRDLGWRGPLLMLEGCFEQRDLELCSRLNLWHSVHCDQQIDWLAEHKTHTPHRVFLKLNSGMNRLGYAPAAYAAAYARAEKLHQRGVLGSIIKMTHFATADGPQGITEAMAIFARATEGLAGGVSVCNSAATLRFPEIAVSRDGTPQWVRPGVCLYGATPFPDATAASYGLRAAMTLTSEIIGVQSVSAGGGEKDFPGLSSCIASRIRGWKFPASSGSTPVDVPFVFAAQ